MTNPRQKAERSIWQLTPATVGAITIGVLGSGMWDLLAKPGLGRLSRLAISLVTLGSSAVRDIPYASAALDPASLPGLLIILLLGILPFVGGVAVLLIRYSRPWIRNRLRSRMQQLRVAGENGEENARHWLHARANRATWVLALYLFGIGLVTFVGTGLVS
jgi:hypothetical protein